MSMDFELSEMQQMLVDSASRLMNDHSGVEFWRERRALPDGLDPAMWSQFAELGWLALGVPEDAGGLGGSAEDVALLMTQLGRGLAPDPIVSSGVLAVRLVDRLATGARREELLGSLASGELRLALAHDEAGDRYELDTPRRTVARRTADGFTLAGRKLMALDAPSAHRLLVTASIEGEGEGGAYGLFLVDAGTPGLAVNGYPLVDGSHAADCDLDDVAVPAAALLGQGAAAVAAVEEAVDHAQIALIAQAVGAMEAAVEITSAYIKERKQFGQPIGKFQALQHMASEAFVAAYLGRSALYQALAAAEGPAAERKQAVSMARVAVADAGKQVGHKGVQMHGGYGVTDEYAISHYWRRLYALERTYGDAQFHLARLVALGQA